VNLLLVEASELTGDTVTLAADDRRAVHLRGVLGVHVGARVRAGVVGGATGTAEVVADAGTLVLRLALTEPARASLPIELVLAVPRPKVLTRTVEAAAAFGIERITLTNAWRVDKAYLRSPRLAPDALALAARLGAEQGGVSQLPAITVYERLMALLDEHWPIADPSRLQLIAHPGAPPIEDAVTDPARPIVLAIGPEGGWIAREVETFVVRGFTPVALAPTILRVETAVAAALGQLVLLRRHGTSV
jgi:16S rRNA (uracil1498-N3)-methyltransferase